MKKLVLATIGLLLTGGLAFLADRIGLLREGDIAPPFSARLTTGEMISLGDYRGKKVVVLFFYPKDFSSGCTAEACSYRDNYAEVLTLDGVLLGVSYDDDATHGAFIEKYRLPFPLISDGDRSISKAYGAARLGGLVGLQRRVTYVIDKGGIIRKVSHHEFRINLLIDDVIKSLKALHG